MYRLQIEGIVGDTGPGTFFEVQSISWDFASTDRVKSGGARKASEIQITAALSKTQTAAISASIKTGRRIVYAILSVQKNGQVQQRYRFDNLHVAGYSTSGGLSEFVLTYEQVDVQSTPSVAVRDHRDVWEGVQVRDHRGDRHLE